MGKTAIDLSLKNQESTQENQVIKINSFPESWEILPLEKTGEVIYGIQASVANNIGEQVKFVGTDELLDNKASRSIK